ncbi:MAG: ankyrin repeat domain-containing protein [Synergistaceae bacterium]|jgi:ankyrin repeat protein|nr:ankyrin repeat domain-containing protein [Synergistaceae bacterium]
MKKSLCLVVALATLVCAGIAAAVGADELFIALCAAGTPEDVQKAIADGANVNAQSNGGWTPLTIAAASNPNPGAVSALIKAGADVNAVTNTTAGEWTPLMLAAAYNGNPEVISALLKAGADPKAKDNNGVSVLAYANENDNLKDTTALAELTEAANR